MVTPVNDRDVMLQAAASRDVDPLAGKYVQVDMTAQLFHVSPTNQGSPSTITLTAIPVNIVGGTPTFSTDNGTLTGTGFTRTLAFSSLTGDTANIVVSITDNNGKTFTTTKVVSKVYDGAKGDTGTGTAGAQYATAFLYQFSTTAPSKPSGTSTYNWATGNNTNYSANDGWTVTVPANNGNPLASLYVVAVPITAAGGATSSSVSYASSTVQAWSQNGAKGDTGSSGMQYATASIYQPNANTPNTPVGSATWNWATGTFDNIPSGWTLNPPTTLAQGYTLWAARVSLVTAATATQTPFNWNAATFAAIGYAGTNGTGQTGSAGSSYVTAYCASSTPTTSTTPATTTGINSVPAQNDGGITGTWQKTVPQLVSGQYLFVTDGIYDPSTGKVTWSIPYWSSFKVGSLSAVSSIMGKLTISDLISDAGGNWSIDATGKMTCKSWQLLDGNGTVVLQAGGNLNATYAAAGTLNSALVPSITAAATTATWSSVTGTGKPADNATVGATWGSNVAGQPDDTTNLVNKTSFEDGAIGKWGGSIVAVTGQSFSNALQVINRDTFENNRFPVTPGETLFVSAWLDASTAGYAVAFGCYYVDAAGNAVSSGAYNGSSLLAKGASWTSVSSSHIVPANAAFASPWLQIGGAQSATDKGTARGARFRISRSQTGATVGAPSGTSVGGTEAGLLATRALNGDTAYNAVNNATTGLAARMGVSIRNVLAGAGGIVAGSLQFDTNGNRTSGYGVMWTQSGIVAYNSGGTPTFVVDASSGLITARSIQILGPNDQVILSSGSTLAQQVYSNPNLCPTPRGMRYSNGAAGNRNGDGRFGDGQYVYLPRTSTNGVYVAAESYPLGIPANSSYTVSFDAYCEAETRNLNVDLYNGVDYDSNGLNISLTNSLTRYSFTEVCLNNGNAPLCWLRMWAPNTGGPVVIANIKVELGTKVTPWCDSVITPDNASTFIQAASINSAHINRASIGSLDAISARIGTLQTATSGQRSQLSDNGLQIFNGNNLAVIQIGFF